MPRNRYHMCSKSRQRNSVAILVAQGRGHHVVQHIRYRCQLDCVYIGFNGGKAVLPVWLHKAMGALSNPVVR